MPQCNDEKQKRNETIQDLLNQDLIMIINHKHISHGEIAIPKCKVNTLKIDNLG